MRCVQTSTLGQNVALLLVVLAMLLAGPAAAPAADPFSFVASAAAATGKQIFIKRDYRCRPSLLRRHLARARLHCRESGKPVGPAEWLYSGRGSERRLHRRFAVRR